MDGYALIGFESAKEYWQYRRNDESLTTNITSISEAARKDRYQSRSSFIPNARVITALGPPEGIRTKPLALALECSKIRIKSESVESRLWKAPPGNHSVRINDIYRVSTPEACLAQMARRVDLIELIALGFEFCGTYSISDRSAKYNRDPIASKASIEKMAQLLSNTKGTKAFRRATKYILEDSASPAETQLAMLLTLHPLLGGYGLPAPKMNRSIAIPKHLQPMLGHEKLRCDLLWQGDYGLVGVEYKSDEFHLDKKHFTADSKRNNALKEIGVTVIEVTTRQLYNSKEFDRIAHQIARAIKYRLRTKVENQMSRRFELRKKVLFQLYPADNNATATSAAVAANATTSAVNVTGVANAAGAAQQPTSASGSRDWSGERSRAPRSGGSYSGR